MSKAILRAERVTRDLTRRLGFLTLDTPLAAEMCDVGQGLMIGGCTPSGLVRHLAWAVSNLQPHQCVVACHSYESAEAVAESCRDRGVAAAFLDRNERPTARTAAAPVIVTVPERLYHLGPYLEDGRLSPRALFLVDPEGGTLRRTRWEDRDVCRAEAVRDFRGRCLPLGLRVIPVLWTACPTAAFFPEVICRVMGVEALVYLDGSTLRTAALSEEPDAEAAGDVAAGHWLDAEVVAARERRSRLLVVACDSYRDAEDAVRDLAELRGYPSLSFASPGPTELHAVLNAGGPGASLGELRRAIDSRLQVVNKIVVPLFGVDFLYDKLGATVALHLLAVNTAGSLLVVPGPTNLSRPILDDLFRAHQRLEPGLTTPHVAVPPPSPVAAGTSGGHPTITD